MLQSPRFKNDPHIAAAWRDKPPFERAAGKNTGVAIVQRALIDLGFPMPRSLATNGTADGVFGAETQAAVKNFQKANHLPQVDGIVGRDTLEAMDRLLIKQVANNQTIYERGRTQPNGKGNWGEK